MKKPATIPQAKRAILTMAEIKAPLAAWRGWADGLGERAAWGNLRRFF